MASVGKGAAKAESWETSDRSRRFLPRHESASGGLFFLPASRGGGTAAPQPTLLFSASVLLSSPGFFSLLLNS